MPDMTCELVKFRITRWQSVLQPRPGVQINIFGDMTCDARLHDDPQENRLLLECRFHIASDDAEVFDIQGEAEAYFSISSRDEEIVDELIETQCVPMAQQEMERRVAQVTEDFGFTPVKLG